MIYQKGKVLTAGATVYKSPDFDSPVIGTLKLGSLLNISKSTMGAFYQVQISKSRVGYVSDVDVRGLNEVKKAQKSLQAAKEERAALSEERKEELLKKRPYDSSDFKGFELAMIRFRENTMSLRPTDQRLFAGFTASGPHIIIDGLYTDFNFLFSSGAPVYYEQATGKSTDGFILITNFMFQTVTARHRDLMTYVGFGPMFRYSRFGVTFTNLSTGKDESYSLVDMAVGAVFDLGVGMRFGQFSLKGELQYYWEKLPYTGIAASGQMSF